MKNVYFLIFCFFLNNFYPSSEEFLVKKTYLDPQDSYRKFIKDFSDTAASYSWTYSFSDFNCSTIQIILPSQNI